MQNIDCSSFLGCCLDMAHVISVEVSTGTCICRGPENLRLELPSRGIQLE